jgi:hypothetical protein
MSNQSDTGTAVSGLVLDATGNFIFQYIDKAGIKKRVDITTRVESLAAELAHLLREDIK